MAQKPSSGLNAFAYVVGGAVMLLFVAYGVRQLYMGAEIPIGLYGLFGIVVGALFGKNLPLNGNGRKNK